MESDNATVVRRIYELFNRLGSGVEVREESPAVGELMELFDDSVDFVQPSQAPDQKDLHGKEAFRAGWVDWLSAWGRHRSEPEEIVERGDHVLVLSTDRFVGRGGLEVDQRGGAIYRFSGGRVVWMRAFWRHEDARQAFEELQPESRDAAR